MLYCSIVLFTSLCLARVTVACHLSPSSEWCVFGFGAEACAVLRGVAKTSDGLELDLYNSILLDATESDLEARSWSVRGTIIRVEEKDVGYTSVAGECDDSSDSSLSQLLL